MFVQVIKSLVNVGAALWIGIQCCVGLIVAPYLFKLAAQKSQVVPNTGVAATLIGPLLHQVDAISVWGGAAVLLGLLVLRSRGERSLGSRFWLGEIGVATAIVTAAINLWFVAGRIAQVKEQLAEKYGAYHLADKTDALYGQFGAWHGISTLLFLAGFVGSIVCVFCLPTTARLGTTRDVG